MLTRVSSSKDDFDDVAFFYDLNAGTHWKVNAKKCSIPFVIMAFTFDAKVATAEQY